VRSEITPSGRTVSSLLSVDELLLVYDAGYVPLGIVVGAAVFHVGIVGSRMANVELVPLSQALLAAREVATSHMRDHATQLSASGVIGVQVEITAFEDRRHLARVVATGTAIRKIDREAPPAVPFVAGLSGQEFRLLVDGGYEPVSLVMGVCVYHIARKGLRTRARNVRTTAELSNYTAALYEARELAMRRLQGEALASDADGVVGVTISEKSHTWGAQAIEFFCMGTSIRLCREARIEQPSTVFSVRDLHVATDPTNLHHRSPRATRKIG
jgi:uncharacterized protein YbjQ (UPF0145 family)